MHRSLLLVLLLPLIAVAQSVQPSTDDSAAQPPGSVEGRVTNAQTGEGISGARILLIPIHRRGTSTSSAELGASSQGDGSFIVDNVPPGEYLIIATQSAFAAGPNGARSRPTVDVAPSQAVSNVSVQLNPVGRIRGKVVDDEGKPVAGARVRAFMNYTARGKAQLRQITETATDESGKYTLRTQEPGKCYVSAELEGNDQSKSDDETGSQQESGLELVRTFYPKSLNIENATAIDVSAGQDATDMTIQLVRTAAHHIRGKVEGLDASARRPLITLGPRGSLASDGVGTVSAVEKDGTFDIPKVISGSYTLSVEGNAENPATGAGRASFRRRLLARQDVDVGADDVNGIVLPVIPLITLSGRVTVDGLDNADLSQIRVNLIPSGAAAVGGFQSISVQHDGMFRIEDLAPGQYMVRILAAPSGTYIKSVTYNRQDITTTGLDLTGGGTGEIDILLRTGTGEVDGTLQSGGQSSPTAVMILAPETPSQDGSGVLIANMQPTGSFIARNVAPGHYYAYAVERWSPLWQNPDFLRSFQNQGTTVDLPENGHLQVQLSVVSNDQVEAAAAPLGLTSQ